MGRILSATDETQPLLIKAKEAPVNDSSTIRILNDLLDTEGGSLLARLNEAPPFVHWAGADDGPLLQQIAADQLEHQRRLTETIVALGGVPRTPGGNMSSAASHYLDLSYFLPRLVAEKRQLIEACRRAAEQVDAPSAGNTIDELLTRHKAHLEQLATLQSERSPGSTA